MNGNNKKTLEELLKNEKEDITKINLSGKIKKPINEIKFKIKLLNLHDLDISNNDFNDSDINILFKSLEGSISLLKASVNKIINLELFEKLPELRVLNISHNEISTVPKTFFEKVNKLQAIILNDNKITKVQNITHNMLNTLVFEYFINNIFNILLEQIIS